MILDEHTACPACPQVVRNLYAATRRIIGNPAIASPEIQELWDAVEALRPFVLAHHANQVHAFSPELEGARNPRLDVQEPT